MRYVQKVKGSHAVRMGCPYLKLTGHQDKSKRVDVYL